MKSYYAEWVTSANGVPAVGAPPPLVEQSDVSTTVSDMEAFLKTSPAYPRYHYFNLADGGVLLGTYINGHFFKTTGDTLEDCEARMQETAEPAPVARYPFQAGYSLREDAARTFKALPWVFGLAGIGVAFVAIMAATGNLDKIPLSDFYDRQRDINGDFYDRQRDINGLINVIHNPQQFVPSGDAITPRMRRELIETTRQAAIDVLWEKYRKTAD